MAILARGIAALAQSLSPITRQLLLVFSALVLLGCAQPDLTVRPLSLGFREWRAACQEYDRISSYTDLAQAHPRNSLGNYHFPVKVQCLTASRSQSMSEDVLVSIKLLKSTLPLLYDRNCSNVSELISILNAVQNTEDGVRHSNRTAYGTGEAFYILAQIADQCGPASLGRGPDDLYRASFEAGFDYTPSPPSD